VGEKTEEATPHKMQESRKKGQICKSKDLPSSFLMIVGFSVLLAQSTTIGQTIKDFSRAVVLSIPEMARVPLSPELAMDLFHRGIWMVISLSAPLLGAVLVVGLLVNFLLVGPMFTMHPLKPDIKKLNPMPTIKNWFKVKSLVNLLLNLVKILVAFYLSYGVMMRYKVELINSIEMEILEIMLLGGSILKDIIIQVGVFFVIMGVVDFLYQKKNFGKEMKMSKDEVKREHKQNEGDPEIKYKRQELAREMLEHAMTENVKKADAVITNPTHIACAIKYDEKMMDAPQLTAKGMRHTAEKIVAIAKKNNVPILRNISLARALSELQLGDSVPEGLYDAIAEVLNFVYELNQGKKPGAGA
jgi:flagellar biosynthesis protein FlhB